MWECWIAPELGDGRIGIVGKVHHCMVDGLAAVELAALPLDGEPDAPQPERKKWQADGTPNGLSLLARGLLDRCTEVLDVARRPLTLLSLTAPDCRRRGRGGRIASAVRNSFGHPARPTGALNPPLSPLRHMARFERPLDDLVRIKRHFGTTVNDVVLAACAGAVRDFLVHHEEPAFSVKAMVPVAQRNAEQAAGLGNRISFLFIDLPSDEADPVARLRAIHATTKERKESGEVARRRPRAARARLCAPPRPAPADEARGEPTYVQPRGVEHPGTAGGDVDARLRSRGGVPDRPVGGPPRGRDRDDDAP